MSWSWLLVSLKEWGKETPNLAIISIEGDPGLGYHGRVIHLDIKSLMRCAAAGTAVFCGMTRAWSLDATTPRYYFATFSNSAQTQLYLASSFDGRRFDPLTGGPVFTTTSPETLRDPSIIKLPDAWYVCHTAGSNLGNAAYFTILRSTDLVNWTKVIDVSTAGIPNTNYTWAPEWFRDDDGSLHILFSVSPLITREHRLYEIHPTSSGQWSSWSAPTELTGSAFPSFTHPPGSTTFVGYYDAYVVKRGGEYHLFYFDVSTSCIQWAKSNALTGPYAVVRGGNWQGIGAYKEGGTMVHLGGTNWRFYFADAIYSRMSYVESTNDWANWNAPVLMDSPVVFNHGTVVFNPSLPELKPSLEILPGLQVRLRFPGVNKNGYQVESSPDLVTWTSLGSVIQGAGAEVLTDHDPAGAGRLFYRVKWLPFHLPLD
ncbi:MAG: hypothetical protein SFU85_13405 [Candidatus Methylacidiphilales bacterium]|nr:hypothetical protein [Candidatus Methylacidiphilales bacterium]